MSLWFRRRDKQGGVHYYSVSIPSLLVVMFLGITVALILALLSYFR